MSLHSHRPNVVAQGGLLALAEGLTASLHENGGLELATPNMAMRYVNLSCNFCSVASLCHKETVYLPQESGWPPCPCPSGILSTVSVRTLCTRTQDGNSSCVQDTASHLYYAKLCLRLSTLQPRALRCAYRLKQFSGIYTQPYQNAYQHKPSAITMPGNTPMVLPLPPMQPPHPVPGWHFIGPRSYGMLLQLIGKLSRARLSHSRTFCHPHRAPCRICMGHHSLECAGRRSPGLIRTKFGHILVAMERILHCL